MVQLVVVAVIGVAALVASIFAQDVETVVADPSVDIGAPNATVVPVDTTIALAPDATDALVVTEAVATPPVATEAVATVVPEAVATVVPELGAPTAPASLPRTAPDALAPDKRVPAPTASSTTGTLSPATPSRASHPLPSETLAPTVPPRAVQRNPRATSSSSSSSSLAGETQRIGSTSVLTGFAVSKTVAVSVLSGMGLFVALLLLCVVCRARRRAAFDLNTPTLPAFPATATSPRSSVWKSSRSTFASRDLPLGSSRRGKRKGLPRPYVEPEGRHPVSLLASVPHDQSTRVVRASMASDQSLSLRGGSDFSVPPHQGDSDVSGRYSTSDRFSTNGRYSTTSRLSSEPERSHSDRVPPPRVAKAVATGRVSSAASTPTTRTHSRVSCASPDLTRALARHGTDRTSAGRTDVRDWYRVIESPGDTDRYTTTSLASAPTSRERDSFEL